MLFGVIFIFAGSFGGKSNDLDSHEEYTKKLEKKINALRDELEKLLNKKYTKESKREINEKVEYRFTLNEIKNRK